MVKWMAGLAIVAAFLGVVGTFAIIAYLNRHQNKEIIQDEIVKKPEDEKIFDRTTVTPHESESVKHEDAITLKLPAHKPPAVLRKADSRPEAGAGLARNERRLVKASTAKVDNQRPADKKEVVGKIEKRTTNSKRHKEKLFNRLELQQLLARLIRAQQKNNIKNHCIQIFSSPEMKEAGTMSQVGKYLRKQQFTIAGREILSKKVEGIKIVRSGECLRIILGNL